MSESKRVILTGATGLVGGHVLRLCLDDPRVAAVTVLGRRSVGVEHDKLSEVLLDDFGDYSGRAEVMRGHDLAIFCLGAYAGTVPDELFRKITVDYVIAFSEALREHSPDAVFCLLSGQGADNQEKSRIPFARYKGMAENHLLGAGYPRLHIFRPGYIYPVEPRKEPRVSYRIFRALWPALRRVAPKMGINSDDLARAMLLGGLDGTGTHTAPILENADILAFLAA